MHTTKMKQFIFGILIVVQYTNSQDFGYDGEKGPTHWGEQYNSCKGKHQSPININSLDVKHVNLPPLRLSGFDVPSETTINNNGHTVMITMDSHTPIQISGGPLIGTYEFSQLHFHWGDNDTVGSEDLIDGRSFPMELHMVFYKKLYRNARSALDYLDGLAVLAFFYEVYEDANSYYESLVDVLDNVTESKTNITFVNPPTLSELIHHDLTHYYTYNGSLTTPPCSEVVTWIDFSRPISLSHEQIEKFRQIQDEEGHYLTHNFRPIQPLGDRIVWYNEEDLLENDKNFIDDVPDDLNGNQLPDGLQNSDDGIDDNIRRNDLAHEIDTDKQSHNEMDDIVDGNKLENFASNLAISYLLIIFNLIIIFNY